MLEGMSQASAQKFPLRQSIVSKSCTASQAQACVHLSNYFCQPPKRDSGRKCTENNKTVCKVCSGGGRGSNGHLLASLLPRASAHLRIKGSERRSPKPKGKGDRVLFCVFQSAPWRPRNTVRRKVLAFFLLQVVMGTILFALWLPQKEPLRTSNLTILLWTWPYGIRVPIENCFEVLGVPDCHFTADRSWYPKADAVLVHHHDVYLDAQKLPLDPRPLTQRWVWYSPEPPSKHPVPAFMDNLFNLTMSYRRDSDIYAPYGWLEMLPGPQEVTVPPKSKLVAWVVSNWKPDYVQVRVRYYEELRKHIQVDVYGRGHAPLPGNRLLPTLSQYKFYLAFENSRHEDYISEKLWRNAFQSGAVPVVLGPPRKNYESHVPPDSFIHVDDFPGPQELAAFLHALDKNATQYASYFRWRSRMKSVHYKSWGYQFCKACRTLQQSPSMYQTVPELSKWFR